MTPAFVLRADVETCHKDCTGTEPAETRAMMTSDQAYEATNDLLLHAGVRAYDFDARALHRVRTALWEAHERNDDPRALLALAEARYDQIGTECAMASDFALDMRQLWMQVAFYLRRGLNGRAPRGTAAA